MPQAPEPVSPEPVHAFLARFLAHPGAESLEEFCIELLDLEVSRELYILSAERVGQAYATDANRALRVLTIARRRGWPDNRPFGPAWFWLRLLGHRLALERGLPKTGIPALAEVASRRFNLPLDDTRLWSCDTLFEKYTRTVLRGEWDYRGLLTPSPEMA